MVQQWRRTPPGKALQALEARRQSQAGGQPGQSVKFRNDLMSLDVDEFEELLMAERMSQKMRNREIEIFKALKEQRDVKKKIAERKLSRANRQIDEGLDEYVEAELRRTLGVAADDVIKEMKEKHAD